MKRWWKGIATLALLAACVPLVSHLSNVDAARSAAGAQRPHFLGPHGIAIDRAGNVYVADDSGIAQGGAAARGKFGSRILKLSPNGNLLATFKAIDNGHGKYGEPYGLALDRGGNIYVSATRGDNSNSNLSGFEYIRKLSPQGKPQSVWGKLGYVDAGAGGGSLAWPWGLAVDARGNIYTTECFNNRVQKFSPQGKSLALWSNLSLNCPQGIAVDAQGRVFVVDHGNSTVLMLSSSGKTLRTWTGAGPLNAHPAFTDPTGVAVDRQGNFYVVVTNSTGVPKPALIVKMAPSGKLLAQWSYKFPSAQPVDLAIDAHGSVYVTSDEGRQIVKYSPAGKVVAVWK
jgi:tripartite motif-containing protein 71